MWRGATATCLSALERSDVGAAARRRRGEGTPPYGVEQIRAVFLEADVRNPPHSRRGGFRASRYRIMRKETQHLCPLNLWGQRCVRSNRKAMWVQALPASKPDVRNPPHSRRGGFRANRYRIMRKETQHPCPLNLWGQGCIRSNADRQTGCRPCLPIGMCQRRLATVFSKPDVRNSTHSCRVEFRVIDCNFNRKAA